MESAGTGGPGASLPRTVLARVDAFADADRPEPPSVLASLAAGLPAGDGRSASQPSILDRTLGRWSEADTARRIMDRRPSAVVLGSGRNAALGAGAADARALAGVGRRISASHGAGPVRIALVERVDQAETVLREEAAELALRGDAEETLPFVLSEALTGRLQWAGVRGISWREPGGGAIRHEEDTTARSAPRTPDWDLVDLGRYSTRPSLRRLLTLRGRSLTSATIATSQACGPGCPTCHGSFGISARERSVRDVIAEIRDLVRRHGVRRLRIHDHAFDGRPARAAEIARALATFRSAPGLGGLTVEFPRGLRGDGLTPELIERLLEAGVRRFPLRIETASPRLQRLLRQNVDLGRASDALEAIAAKGGIGHVELRLGLPTETTGEAARTIRWARESAAHTAHFANGRDLEFGSPSGFGDGDDDYPAMRRRAIRSFYTCPRRLARLAAVLPRAFRPSPRSRTVQSPADRLGTGLPRNA